MNSLLLGPLLGNNRARLIERCAALVTKDQTPSFLYLAASHPLLELVTQGILDGDKNRGVWGELPVYLFRGFIRRILTSAVDAEGCGLPPRLPIDREELPLKRSLISQILNRLLAAGRLTALAPLAGHEGCINSITTLVGEIQRAAKTPTEVSTIIASRAQDISSQPSTGRSQLDFDKEIALIYSTYCDLLNENRLTEDDADQLHALEVLRGSMELPWLAKVELLVLDGFFDFTPVQGEILRLLIPRIPETLVNLNHDNRNPEIFVPFQETIDQLKAISSFRTNFSTEHFPADGALINLRENLFNPALTIQVPDENDADSPQSVSSVATNVRYLECGDRDTEIRAIAREIKRLIITENYDLADVALVVRQRATYASTIARVMHEERLPCNLEARIDIADIPAARAALKLLALIEQPIEQNPSSRITDLADLVKSEYFRLNDNELSALSTRFDEMYLHLLLETDQPHDQQTIDSLKLRHRIGFWDADALENAFAYVGSELPVSAWLIRCQKLVKELPSAEATKEILNIDSKAHDREADIADQVENAETVEVDEKGVEKKRRPSRDIHPATLAWTALVIQRFAELIAAVPRSGKPAELRLELMRLLDQFGFRDQIAGPTRRAANENELPQVMLNFNVLEALRRAFLAAIRSIEMSAKLQFVDQPLSSTSSNPKLAATEDQDTPISTFIAETRRSITSQSQILGAADRGGLRVLEATDVRGLRFRAVFIAGLIEGGFPLRVSRDWIYPHEERDRLKDYGLTLEDISPATLLKEEHYFYQAACRASQRLYLTRPLMLEDDSETVASYYIDELRRAIAPLKLKTETVRRDYDGKNLDDVSSSSELRVALVRQQERHLDQGDKDKLKPAPRIKRLLTLARNDGFLSPAALRRIEIERERAGKTFGTYDGQITDPHLVQLLSRKFGADYVHSASGLSVFGNCPYRFFAQRVLKLEPRGEAALDLQAIDAGKLLHDVLRRFFEKHRREPLYELNREDLRKELAQIADDVFDEHERVVPALNRQIWKIDREIRKILLDQVLLYELEIQEQAKVNNVLPAFFELGFGGTVSVAKDPDSIPEPLELTRGTFVGEETVKIRGQIDRIDQADDETIIAYDYKLSLGSTQKDMSAGRSLQIPIYLEALERLLLPTSPVAGGGYYIIRGGRDRRNKGIHLKSKLDYSKLSGQVGSVLSEDDWQQIRAEAVAKIWDFLDRMRAGEFLVDPSERTKTCRFCDYSAVCRYDRDRIERKKR